MTSVDIDAEVYRWSLPEKSEIDVNIAILGGFGKRPLAPGWQRETAFAAIGGGEFDITDSPPAEGAHLVAVAFLGGIKIQVSPGTRVQMNGFSLLGGRSAEVTPGEGPDLKVTAVAILGGVRITDALG
jgi:hypothetical protein